MRTGLRLALLLVLVSVVATAAEDPLREAYVAALQAREQSDFEGYRDHVARALELAPSHPILHQHRARAHAQLGQLEEATRWLRSSLDLGARMDLEDDPWLEPLRGSELWTDLVTYAEHARRHVGPGDVGLRLERWDLLPEGIAHDDRTGVFYLSSISGRNIVRVLEGGDTEDFIATEEEGFPCGLGLQVDPSRGWLWACGSADSSLFAHSADLRTGVWAFDLEDGSLAGRWLAPTDSLEHNLNDLEVLPTGEVFVTEAGAGALYVVRPDASELEEFRAPGTLAGPNGITHEGRRLFVAEYSRGIRVLDLDSGADWLLDSGPHVTLVGVDGLYQYEGSLVAIQNAMGLDRVVRLRLDDERRSVVSHEILEARHPRMDDPTTGVIVGNELWYIANSHIATYQRLGGWPEPSEFGDTLILRVGL